MLRRMADPTLIVCSAAGFWARTRGLIGRPPPRPGTGLWLSPCRWVHTFGMRYPIDVVFLDRDRTVLEVVTVAPWRLSPWVGAAESVVELIAGEAARLGIGRGGKVSLIAEEVSCYDG